MVPVVVIREADATAARLARRRRTAAIMGLVAVLAGFAWVLAVVSSLVGFVFAVGAAIGWCVWLEKYPEAKSRSQIVNRTETRVRPLH
jgi:hypothetical protein